MICGVNIGGKDTLEEWGLMLCNDLSIGAAVPRYRFIEIPEMSGALDLTEALTGSVPYDQRTITFTLFAVHDVIAGTRSPATEEHFQTVLARFSGFANGKRLHLYLPDNPDHYFVGRVSVGGKSGYNSGRVKVEVLADPYRIKDGETTLTVDDDDFFKTATPGALVTFDDGGDDLPMKSCVVSLVPEQDLNGYDSPWPAGGGKNLLKTNDFSDYTNNGVTWHRNDDGSVVLNGTATARSYKYLNGGYYLKLEPGTYTASASGLESGGAFGNVAYSTTENGAYAGSFGNIGGTIPRRTITVENTIYLGLLIDVPSGATNSNRLIKIQIEEGSTATEWSPYSNICPISGHTGAELKIGATYPTAVNTYSVTFSDQGTVYGGTFDFVSGKLTVTRAVVDMGTLNWQWFTNNRRFVVTLPDGKKTGTGYGIDSVCSAYKTTDGPYGSLPDKCLSVGSNFISGSTCAVVVHDESYTNAATFKTAMSGVQLVYELATPLEYTLSAQQIETLLGENNVWSNDGDISELIYMFTDEIIINNEGMQAIPTINASEAGPTVTLRGASHVLAAGDNRFSDFILQSGENVMQVEDPAGTLTIKYQEGML